MPSIRLIPIGLRLPPELAAWLKEEAARNQRSVANQTAWALQQYRTQQAKEAAGADR
jgi:hypothetical protein